MNPDDALWKTLLSSERRLFLPEVRRSRKELETYLSEDFIEIGSSGQVFTREQIILETAGEEPVEITLSEFQLRVVAPDVALVTYRARISDRKTGKSGQSIRSSIWKKTDGLWRMIFHQGTPAANQ